MHRKPTQPFGHINFSKSGRVTKEMHELSGVKEEQEAEVVERFAAAFNEQSLGSKITDIRRLAENDHDAAASLNGAPLQIQVTELTARAYAFPMTKEEYDECAWSEAMQLAPGLPHRVDVTLRDRALWEVIDKKLRKHYSRPRQGQLWLLVFTVGHLYQTEFIEAGKLVVSHALRQAREQLTVSGSGPFDEIWISDLLTRPIKVWPLPSSDPSAR